MSRRQLVAGLALLLVAASGCDAVEPPPFSGVPDAVTRDTKDGASRDDLPPVSDGAVLCRQHEGSIRVATKADLAQLDYVRVLRGDLVMAPVEGLWNQSVREVAGSVRIAGTRDEPVQAHVTLAAVGVIGGDIELADTLPGMVDIYRLRTLGGRIVGHDGGWGLWTPDLEELGGGIDVRDASQLALTLERVASLGGPIRIERTRGFARLQLGPAVSLPAPAGGGDALRLVDNPDLVALDLGGLRTIDGHLRITGNARLTRAAIDRALEPVIVVGDTLVCGNREDVACP